MIDTHQQFSHIYECVSMENYENIEGNPNYSLRERISSGLITKRRSKRSMNI